MIRPVLEMRKREIRVRANQVLEARKVLMDASMPMKWSLPDLKPVVDQSSIDQARIVYVETLRRYYISMEPEIILAILDTTKE